MKKWYQWFYLSLGFVVGGIINYLDNKQIVAAVIQVGITVTLGFIQFLCDKCDKKGEKGKKVFNYISIAAIVLIIVWLIYLVFSLLR